MRNDECVIRSVQMIKLVFKSLFNQSFVVVATLAVASPETATARVAATNSL